MTLQKTVNPNTLAKPRENSSREYLRDFAKHFMVIKTKMRNRFNGNALKCVDAFLKYQRYDREYDKKETKGSKKASIEFTGFIFY